MFTAARWQMDQDEVSQVELIEVRATKPIALADGTLSSPTVIAKGEVFWVNMIPLEGLQGFVGNYNGESFFVELHEFKAICN